MSDERAKAAVALMNELTDAELVQVLVKAVEVKGSDAVDETILEIKSRAESAGSDL